ncbi:MAG TPA: hypothetical protein VF666_11870 [Pyrinomonadaceae bacterium]|jgi:hypothetical protein
MVVDKSRADNDDEKSIGHSSTTAPGGEKEMGDPGRTPGKAEGDEETVDESLRQKGIE